MIEVKNGVLVINGVPVTVDDFVVMLEENPAALDAIHDEMLDIMVSHAPQHEQLLLKGELAVIRSKISKIENPIERALVMSQEMLKFGIKIREDAIRRGEGPLPGPPFHKK